MDKFFVNPGSATGAFSTGWGTGEGEEEEVVPSFCLMDVGCASPPLALERCCWLQAARGLVAGGKPGFAFGAELTRSHLGPRHIADALCVPTEEGRERR